MLTSDFFNKPTIEEKTRLDPKCWTGKKIGDPKTKMQGGVRVNNCVPVEEEAETNPIDTVKMAVPLLIRALEYAREDAKDDMDLHKVVERMIVAAQAGDALNMDDYNMIFGDSEQGVEEATGDKPFDSMMKNISTGTAKQKTADRKEQRKQTQQQARDAFGNMFGGGNPADKLKIKEQGVAEGWRDEMPSDMMSGTMDKIRTDINRRRYQYLQNLLKKSKKPETIAQIKALLAKEFPQGVAEGVTSPEIKQAYNAIMQTTPRSPERRAAIAKYQKLRADALNKKQQGVAEGSGMNVVKSVKVGNFRHDLVDTGFGWQVRIYNGDELYDTGLSKNSEQKGLVALDGEVAYTKKQLNIKEQGVAEAQLDELTGMNQGPVKRDIPQRKKPTFAELAKQSTDKRSALQRQKDGGKKNWFAEDGVAEGQFDPINDDDFYEYNVNTNKIVKRISGKHPIARQFSPMQKEWAGRDTDHKIVKGMYAKYLKPKGQDVVDEAKKKKKKKSSLMSKPTKRTYGGYFYPGYGYGDSGDSGGGGDGGGGGESRMNESRLYYTVAGTLNESLRKDFKMRKDRKGWFLPESASSRQKLDAERAFGEPVNEADLLRPIKMNITKDPVARSENASKFKNPAKLTKFKK